MTANLRIKIVAWGAAVIALLFATMVNAHGFQAEVELNGTLLNGQKTDFGAIYKGIPYAQPPVGELRWQPPQSIELPPVFSATAFGSGCPQLASAFGVESTNEDCLFLNVYQPKGHTWLKSKKGRPVIVWIHGGSLTSGVSSVYDASRLAERGAVVVTINYRLGALGFLAHPALSAESDSNVSGNYGIMDQQAALEWVRDNIAAFGGNPDNVTLMGESAGGYSVLTHMASPLSAGLFHRAIVQSGAYAMGNPTLEEWELVGLGLASAMGCDEPSIECLRDLSVESILNNQNIGALGYLSIVDGVTLPQSVLSALATGAFNKVPVMQGTTADEYALFVALAELEGAIVTPETYQAAIMGLGFPEEAASVIAAQYPLSNYVSPGQAYAAVGTDVVFSCNSQLSSQLISLHAPTYVYEFNDKNAPGFFANISFPMGAYHGSELQYLFNVALGSDEPREYDRGQKVLSHLMLSYWISFAAFGNPNFTIAPRWSEYGIESQSVNSLQPIYPFMSDSFNLDHQCGFWAELLSPN